ncbi:MAG TPA: LLM class flavin-dependent oxidoreductase [Acidimicrobiales bacterium]|jgi:5,10-methylenetetrahydromethanopterin reductase|nr:LLM class flavin-dependent oxidoreductase [Acidimicrobiales bacterium]
MPGLEFWTVRLALPGTMAGAARRLEDEGWRGLALGDSQNLAADPYVELTVAAAATSTLGLATAVTNPVTRHPAATATAIATVQAESGGRAVLGIGRGDSALAHIGLAPAPVAMFEGYVAKVQDYLRAEDVPFDAPAARSGEVRAADTLGMAGAPTASRLRWLPEGLAKVPVDVMATGPNVIAAAARVADRITFAVGADPRRLEWAMDAAATARSKAGLPPPDARPGIFLPVVVHEDRATARRLISGAVGSFARFSVMHGTVTGPVSDSQRHSLEAVHSAYDMNSHFRDGSPQAHALTEEVIDAFGIAGPASYCIDRLSEMAEMGVGRVVVAPGAAATGHTRDELRAARRRLVDEVLPALA